MLRISLKHLNMPEKSAPGRPLISTLGPFSVYQRFIRAFLLNSSRVNALFWLAVNHIKAPINLTWSSLIMSKRQRFAKRIFSINDIILRRHFFATNTWIYFLKFSQRGLFGSFSQYQCLIGNCLSRHEHSLCETFSYNFLVHSSNPYELVWLQHVSFFWLDA